MVKKVNIQEIMRHEIKSWIDIRILAFQMIIMPQVKDYTRYLLQPISNRSKKGNKQNYTKHLSNQKKNKKNQEISRDT